MKATFLIATSLELKIPSTLPPRRESSNVSSALSSSSAMLVIDVAEYLLVYDERLNFSS